MGNLKNKVIYTQSSTYNNGPRQRTEAIWMDSRRFQIILQKIVLMHMHETGDGVATSPGIICGFGIFGTETKTEIFIKRKSL